MDGQISEHARYARVQQKSIDPSSICATSHGDDIRAARYVTTRLGFDFSRIEYNIKDGIAKGDGLPLIGWEFHIIEVTPGLARGEEVLQEYYGCAAGELDKVHDPDTEAMR